VRFDFLVKTHITVYLLNPQYVFISFSYLYPLQITAVSVAMKNKMDLAIGVAVGSSTQISLFVVPVTVIFGWCVGKPMTLNYPIYEISLYILSIFTVSVCLGTGKSNWLLGSVLITTYFMLGIGFWFEKVENF
ncbi:MAG: Ca2+:H+ antiporter, partial [Bacillariaceae sp.]|jgi:Ca2+:H+ antiporter